MASGPPTGGPPPAQLLEQTPPPSPTSWDGDRMFNIYIYDYCIKRGYANTARELTREADIPQDSSPPINAKQGLLFEWWSVFWVLFTAKSSGNGPEDAILYTQHQAQQTQRQPARPGPQPGPARYMGPVNGTRPGGPPAQMPNGIAAQPGQPMTNGAQGGAFGPGPQPNGIVGPSHPAGPSIGTPAMMAGQRPGAAPPQRGPNGAPFQSPTIANSPHQTGSGHIGQQPPINNNLGPQGSIQMRNAMAPPGHPQGPMGNPQQPPPGFPPLQGSSASHPNSPAAHGVSQSPSFANRQPQLPQGQGRPPNPDIPVNTEFMRIDSVRLNSLKEELGLGSVDVPSLSISDKTRIVALAKERGAIRDQLPKPGVPQNAPDGQPNRLQPPPLQPGQQRQLGPPFAQQGQNQQRIKRNSTSPGDEAEQGQNESSPPASKRPRISPTGSDQQPPMAGLGFPPQPPMHVPGGPQHPPNAMTPLLPSGAGSFASGQRMGNPAMNAPHIPPSMMQYRQTMSALHKGHIPPGVPNMLPTNAPSPAAAESPFPQPGDGSQSRPGTGQFPGNRGPQQQNKPTGMMPPPSPGLKKDNDPGAGIGSVHSSPHNLPASTGGLGPQQPPQQAPGTAPPTPAQNAATITAPSPSGMNTQPTPGSQGQPLPQAGSQPPLPPPSAPPLNSNANDMFLNPDFMQQLNMGAFESFDSSSLFPGDQMGTGGDLDFGEWFTSDSI